MYCNNCSNEVLAGSRYCNNCGEKLSSEETTKQTKESNGVSERDTNNYSKKLIESNYRMKNLDEEIVGDASKNSKKPWTRKKKLVTLVATILSLVIISSIIIYIAYQPDRKYAHAVSLMNANNYEQAILEFQKLKDFKDSSELITESRYLYAKQLIIDEEYLKAKEIVLDLDSYKDSLDLRLQIEYMLGKHFLEAKSYKEAIASFEMNADYKDSKQLLIHARYLYGKGLANEKKYVEAIAVIKDIKDYKDSNDILAEARYQEGISQYNQGNFSGAKIFLESIGSANYKDTKKYLNQANKNVEQENLLAELLKSVEGTWEDEYGWHQVIFSGNKVTDVIFPDSHDTSVYTWELTIKNKILMDEIGNAYYTKNNKLYVKDKYNGDVSIYSKTSDSTNIPEEKPSPRIGMTADEVRASNWGSPDDINKTTTTYGVSEQWVYDNFKYIYLEDGIVTSIEE